MEAETKDPIKNIESRIIYFAFGKAIPGSTARRSTGKFYQEVPDDAAKTEHEMVTRSIAKKTAQALILVPMRIHQLARCRWFMA